MFCGLGRHGGYDDTKWNIILYGSSFDAGFVEYAQDYPRLDKELKLLSTANTTNTSAIVDLGPYGYFQWKHLMAVFHGYYGTSVLGINTILPCLAPEYWTGWGGDLCTLAQDVDHSNITNELLCAVSLMGQTTASAASDPICGSVGSSFRYEDYIADTDAIGIADIVRQNISNTNTHFFSTIVDLYYTQHVSERKSNLLQNILGIYNLDSLTVVDLAESLFTMITNQRVDISDMGSVAIGIYNAFLDTRFLSLLFFISMNWEEQTLDTPSESIQIAVCLAFAKYILTEE